VTRCPFNHHPDRTGRKPTFENTERSDLDGGLVISVSSMEVRRIMFIVEHGDYNAKESAYFLHLPTFPTKHIPHWYSLQSFNEPST
jgi:hypothetical protein